jgi:hypothetical protein
MEKILDKDTTSIVNNFTKDLNEDEMTDIIQKFYDGDLFDYSQCSDGIIYSYNKNESIKLLTDMKIFNCKSNDIIEDILFNYSFYSHSDNFDDYAEEYNHLYDDEEVSFIETYKKIKKHWDNIQNIKKMINSIIKEEFSFNKNDLELFKNILQDYFQNI